MIQKCQPFQMLFSWAHDVNCYSSVSIQYQIVVLTMVILFDSTNIQVAQSQLKYYHYVSNLNKPKSSEYPFSNITVNLIINLSWKFIKIRSNFDKKSDSIFNHRIGKHISNQIKGVHSQSRNYLKKKQCLPNNHCLITYSTNLRYLKSKIKEQLILRKKYDEIKTKSVTWIKKYVRVNLVRYVLDISRGQIMSQSQKGISYSELLLERSDQQINCKESLYCDRLAAFKSKDENDNNFLHITMENYDYNIYEVMSMGQKLKEIKSKIYAYQIIRGILPLLSLGICCRDISPHNVFVNKDKGFLCDFRDFKRIRKNKSHIVYIFERFYQASNYLILGYKQYQSVDIWVASYLIVFIIKGESIFQGLYNFDD